MNIDMSHQKAVLQAIGVGPVDMEEVKLPVTTATNGVEDDFSSLLVSWPLLATSLAAETVYGVFEAAAAAAGPLPAGGLPAVAGVLADKLLGTARCGVLLGRPCALMLELALCAQELRGMVQHNQGRGMQQLLASLWKIYTSA